MPTIACLTQQHFSLFCLSWDMYDVERSPYTLLLLWKKKSLNMKCFWACVSCSRVCVCAAAVAVGCEPLSCTPRWRGWACTDPSTAGRGVALEIAPGIPLTNGSRPSSRPASGTSPHRHDSSSAVRTVLAHNTVYNLRCSQTLIWTQKTEEGLQISVLYLVWGF